MREITGKTALITGGTKGIGYGIAMSMLKEGMKVAITGRTKEGVATAQDALGDYGDVLGIVSDVRNFSSLEEGVGRVLKNGGNWMC
jgi:3-oxoacyl-[acyl-carrier protein] reductase